MKIIVDKYIPFLEGWLDQEAEMHYLAPEEICADTCRDADALIIRTRTHCDANLLAGSRVQFIATATIGHEHIDKDYCALHGIGWANAPGCNADAVANYLRSVLLYALQQGCGRCLGIIGVGQVGKRVARMAEEMGFHVLKNDPPRAAREGTADFCSLQEIQQHAQLISVHTPLQADTFHLIDAEFLHRCAWNPWIINAARGGICEETALWKADNPLVIDCWENEPHLSLPLLQKTQFGTPHIAGYSQDGKARGTRMAVEAICRHFGWNKDIHIPLPAPDCAEYDIRRDSEALKAHPEQFEYLRNHYPIRRDQWVYPEDCP